MTVLFRQTPRILLASALTLVGLLVFIHWAPEGARFADMARGFGLLVLGLLVLLFFILMTGLLIPFGPMPCELVESFGLAVLVLGLMAIAWPGLRMPWVILVLLVLAVIFVCNLLLYGPQWQRFRRDLAPRAIHFTTDLPPARVWRRLFPDAGHIEHYIYGNAQIASDPQGDPAARLLHYPCRPGMDPRLSLRVTVDACQPVSHFRLQSAIARPDPQLPGGYHFGEVFETFEVSLAALGRGTEVGILQSVYQVPFGTRLTMTLGGWRRDNAASLRDRVEGRRDRSLSGRWFDPPLSS